VRCNLLDGLYDGFPYPSGDRFCRCRSDSATALTDISDKRTTNVVYEQTPTIAARSMHADLTRTVVYTVSKRSTLSTDRAAFRRLYIGAALWMPRCDILPTRKSSHGVANVPASPSAPDGAREDVCCLDPSSINRGGLGTPPIRITDVTHALARMSLRG